MKIELRKSIKLKMLRKLSNNIGNKPTKSSFLIKSPRLAGQITNELKRIIDD
jgi:hypothetical protein